MGKTFHRSLTEYGWWKGRKALRTHAHCCVLLAILSVSESELSLARPGVVRLEILFMVSAKVS